MCRPTPREPAGHRHTGDGRCRQEAALNTRSQGPSTSAESDTGPGRGRRGGGSVPLEEPGKRAVAPKPLRPTPWGERPSGACLLHAADRRGPARRPPARGGNGAPTTGSCSTTTATAARHRPYPELRPTGTAAGRSAGGAAPPRTTGPTEESSARNNTKSHCYGMSSPEERHNRRRHPGAEYACLMRKRRRTKSPNTRFGADVETCWSRTLHPLLASVRRSVGDGGQKCFGSGGKRRGRFPGSLVRK